MVPSKAGMFRSILETSGSSVESRLEVSEIRGKGINSRGLKWASGARDQLERLRNIEPGRFGGSVWNQRQPRISSLGNCVYNVFLGLSVLFHWLISPSYASSTLSWSLAAFTWSFLSEEVLLLWQNLFVSFMCNSTFSRHWPPPLLPWDNISW